MLGGALTALGVPGTMFASCGEGARPGAPWTRYSRCMHSINVHCAALTVYIRHSASQTAGLDSDRRPPALGATAFDCQKQMVP